MCPKDTYQRSMPKTSNPSRSGPSTQPRVTQKTIREVLLQLSQFHQAIITEYQLAVLLFNQYRLTLLFDDSLQQKTTQTPYKTFQRLREDLLGLAVLTPTKDFPREKVYNIVGKAEPSPEEIVCSVDPFAYISHLSAMAYHGLTNRIPKTVFLTTPPTPMWQKFARQKMQKDIGERLRQYLNAGLPKLVQVKMEKVQKRPISRYASAHRGAFKSVKGKELRTATIGRTFLDMLRGPALCGGIGHVIEVFRENATKYEPLIVETIDRHGTLIEKARAGYILEELCKVQNPTVDKWARTAQRGGSRKLDPHSEYSPHYSERWSLSLNIG